MRATEKRSARFRQGVIRVDKNELVTSGEAARRLGVSPPTLRKRIQRGELEIYIDPLNDRKRLVRVTDLEPLRHPRLAHREQLAEISAA